MLYFLLFFVIFSVSAGISILWAKGIDNMKKNHPNYKGEDFLSTSAGRDYWDDNLVHTESEI